MQKIDRSNMTLPDRVAALEAFQDSLTDNTAEDAKPAPAKKPITVAMLAACMLGTAKSIGLDEKALVTIADPEKATEADVAAHIIGALNAMGTKPADYADLTPVANATIPAITAHLIKLNEMLNMPVADYEDLLPA